MKEIKLVFSCEVEGTIFNFSKLSGNVTHSCNISGEIQDELRTTLRSNRQCVGHVQQNRLDGQILTVNESVN